MTRVSSAHWMMARLRAGKTRWMVGSDLAQAALVVTQHDPPEAGLAPLEQQVRKVAVEPRARVLLRRPHPTVADHLARHLDKEHVALGVKVGQVAVGAGHVLGGVGPLQPVGLFAAVDDGRHGGP